MGGDSGEPKRHTTPGVAPRETRRLFRQEALHVTELPEQVVDELGSVAPPTAAAEFDSEYGL